MKTKREHGDFQTPSDLARDVVTLVARVADTPCVVLEPTCGTGAFVSAAAEAFPNAALIGFDIDAKYVSAARRGVPRAKIRRASFFEIEWSREIAALPPGHVLVLGNPPWVTSAALGALDSKNLPAKKNTLGMRGIEARTGASNFDISEWMTDRLIDALIDRRSFTLALLLKVTVARKVLEHVARERYPVRGEIRRVVAKEHFGASVDAGLLVVQRIAKTPAVHAWPVFDALADRRSRSKIAVVGKRLTSDFAAYRRTRSLEAETAAGWRSGVKHDCATVFELETTGDLEDEVVYPLLKGSDLAHDRLEPRRLLLVPQRSLGDDLAERAPRAFSYLKRHRERLLARKSSVYEGRPFYAIFGVGDYSFAPFKIAISGLHKHLSFRIVGPCNGKPVMFDDTCYFLPFQDEAPARRALAALSRPQATEFFGARIFWDDKRPITKRVLDTFGLVASIELGST